MFNLSMEYRMYSNNETVIKGKNSRKELWFQNASRKQSWEQLLH